MNYIINALLAALFFIGFQITQVNAAEYSVCSSGCSEITIQAVFDNNDLGGGDVVIIKPDIQGEAKVYREQVVFGIDDEGTEGVPLIVRGEDGVSIFGSDVVEGFQAGGESYSKPGITKEVFLVYRNGEKLPNSEWAWNNDTLFLGFDPEGMIIEAGQRETAIDTNGRSHITIKDLRLGHANTAWKAVLFAYENGNDINVERVSVTGSAHAGIWIKGANNSSVKNSVIRDSADNCLEFSSDNGQSVLTVSTNIITDCGNRGILVQDHSSFEAVGNQIENTSGAGIEWIGRTQPNVDVSNIHSNSLVNTSVHGIQLGGATGKTATNAHVNGNSIQGVAKSNSDGYCVDIDIGTIDALVHDNNCTDAAEAGIGTIGSTTQGNEIYSNTIIRAGKTGSTSQAGLLSGSGANNNQWHDNVIVDSVIGIALKNNSTGHDFTRNLIHGVENMSIYIENGSSAQFDLNLFIP